ncbi:hypothetical protein [Metabacillus iocasae]|uniref:Uncharacterized protein n=1 Tax=Priestia iocasae TaxID=2291674 RepID=A0ABS2QY46_9BACI|nr:hypothetical protein [Metabacillus iocasae]MBM7704342.1 hypothetical protein [Metabacillus iocasae]
MENYSKEAVTQALRVVDSSIRNCENMQPKFAEGTSQHTLLKNRIKALSIAKSCLTDEPVLNHYTKDEVREALQPLSSIIRKCEKATRTLAQGTPAHTRCEKIIKAMCISKALITDKMS